MSEQEDFDARTIEEDEKSSYVRSSRESIELYPD